MRIFSPATVYSSAVILSEPEGGTTERESKAPINLEDGKPTSGSFDHGPGEILVETPFGSVGGDASADSFGFAQDRLFDIAVARSSLPVRSARLDVEQMNSM